MVIISLQIKYEINLSVVELGPFRSNSDDMIIVFIN